MRARQFAVEFRMAFILCFYLVGLTAPWESSGRTGTLWLAAATNMARSGWVNLRYATITVTIIALACLAFGSSLRVWGRLAPIYMAQSEAPEPPGACGELRNPLYFGSCLVGLATSILMPPGGAAVFLIASGLFLLTLRRFCRIGQTTSPNHPSPNKQADLLREETQADSPPPRGSGWPQALVAEFYPISFTVCFGVLAWRYNAHILVRCLLLCFGLSLIFRAFLHGPNAGSSRRREV